MTDSRTESTRGPGERPDEASAGLRRGSIGLPEVLFQGLGVMAPAFGVAAGLAFAFGQAGPAAPLVFLIALTATVLVALTTGQLARFLPSAGGFYTYISRTVSPRAGFMVGWIFVIWLPPSLVISIAYVADALVKPELERHWGVGIPWWAMTLALCAGVVAIGTFGVRLTGRALIVTGVIEVVIVVALGITGLLLPDGSTSTFSMEAFNPANSPTLQGIYIGATYSVFAFSGWETTAPLAEETRNPRKVVPIALVSALLLVGFVYVIASWGAVVGLGPDNVTAAAQADQNPLFALADHVWGFGWIFLLFAILNSAFCTALGGFSAAVRMWYAMGRTGALPSWLGQIHPRWRTPTNAIKLQIVVIVAMMAVVGLYGVQKTFFLWGLTLTLGLIAVYCSVAIGVVRHYVFGPGRPDRNIVKHVALPAVSSALMLWVGFKSLVPLPEPPTRYAPIVIGVWLAIGLGIYFYARGRGGGEWLADAGKAFDES